MLRFNKPTGRIVVVVCLLFAGPAAAANANEFQLVPDEVGHVLKTPDGRIVFRYMTKKPKLTALTANSVCCLFPVHTPKGVEAVEFAAADHPHHRGIFLAWHGTSCGEYRADFWGWGTFAPTEERLIRNRDVKLVAADAEAAKISVRNDWVIGDLVVMEEALVMNVQEVTGAFVVDMDFRFTTKVDVTLDHTAFGGFCVKGRKGEVTYTAPSGIVDLPNPHHLKPRTNWPAEDWYDYSVTIDGETTIGVAVVDHPANPTTTWHNLEPIHMVNPCIVAAGVLPIKNGQTLALRYRVVVHDGPAPTEQLKKLAADFRAQ
jgi:hypothetical protein